MTEDHDTDQDAHSSAMSASGQQAGPPASDLSGAKRTEAEAGGAAEPVTNGTPAKPVSGNKKILCIEDEHFIGELYDRALTKAGYDVTVVIDGREGLTEAQTDAYDIILLDLMVPTITGIDILRRLRDPKQTQRLHSKIIITTNLEQREEIRADIESQADGYLVKAEITPRELVEFLNNIKS